MQGFIELMMWLSALAVVGVLVVAVGEWQSVGRPAAKVAVRKGGGGVCRGATRVKGSLSVKVLL